MGNIPIVAAVETGGGVVVITVVEMMLDRTKIPNFSPGTVQLLP
jgi:hypothetical protein